MALRSQVVVIVSGLVMLWLQGCGGGGDAPQPEPHGNTEPTTTAEIVSTSSTTMSTTATITSTTKISTTTTTPMTTTKAWVRRRRDNVEWCRSLAESKGVDDEQDVDEEFIFDIETIERELDYYDNEIPEVAVNGTLAIGIAGSPPVFRCDAPNGWQIERSDPVAIPLRGTSDVYLSLYRRQLFGDASPSFAFLQLHGALLDGDFYFRQAVKAADIVINDDNPVTRGKTAVVVAPEFGNHACAKSAWTKGQWYNPNMPGKIARWHAKSWFYGTKSFAEEGWHGISSFEALDSVVDWMESTYPQLEKIVLMGFSAGAMMSVRYMALSEVGVGGKTPRGTAFQAIIGAPSSVLYLSDSRPAKSCVAERNIDPRFYCEKYQHPDSRHSRPDTCGSTWDNYPFGLRNIDNFIRTHYVGNTDAQTLRNRFATKDFWIGVGESDQVPCTIGGCQSDCGALAQGSCRQQRVLNFVHHLEDAIPGYKPKYQVFTGGHAHFNMLCGQTARPQGATSFFYNAFNHGETARDKFSCSVKIVANMGLNGDVLIQKTALSPTECCDYCDNTSGCKAWSFGHKWNQCSLLSSVQGQWPTTDFLSGSKETSMLV